MNCVNHSDAAAVAYCRTCGKALCNACSRNVGGVIYCESCVPAGATVTPKGFGIPPRMHANPSLAGLLGLIPGVGAMYNGQFVKGIIHLGVFVAIVGITDKVGPIMVPVYFVYFFYCVFEAYKTAYAMQMGLPLPDPFGLEGMFGQSVNRTAWPRPMAPPQAPGSTGAPGWDAAQQQAYEAQQQAYAAQQEAARGQGCDRGPAGAVILIALGCLFLLHSMDWFSFSMERVWPVGLIVLGVWMIFKRWTRRVS